MLNLYKFLDRGTHKAILVDCRRSSMRKGGRWSVIKAIIIVIGTA
jgi:hypothetical protein